MRKLRRTAHRVFERVPPLLVTAKVPCFLLIFFLLIFGVLVGYTLDNQLEPRHDSGVYIILAQSLVSGNGYSDVYAVGAPPHTKYPPMFPLLLAPIVYLFGLNFWAMKLFILGLGILALYVVFILFRRLAGYKVALTILVLTGVSHGVWVYSQSILSEMPYLFFSFVALLCLERYQEEPDRILGKGVIAALTVGIASLTRTLGLALLVGGVAYTIFERGNRKASQLQKRLVKGSFLAAVAGLPTIMWFFRTWEVSAGTTLVAYLKEYGLKDYAAADSSITGLRDVFELVYHNLYIYTSTSSNIIFPYLPWLPGKVSAVLGTTVVLCGFLICMRKKRSMLEYYVIPYICALLLFPASYPRYLVPLIPILWYYFLIALREVSQLLPIKNNFARRSIFDAVYCVMLSLLIGMSLTSAIQGNFLYKDKNDSHRVDQDEKRFIDILPWVKDNTDAASVFMWSKPSLRYLISKRMGVALPSSLNRQRILDSIDTLRVNYIVIDSFSTGSFRYLKPVVDEHPELFSLIHQNGTSMVYKVVR